MLAALRHQLRRIRPLRVAYRFLDALGRQRLGAERAWCYAHERLYVNATARQERDAVAVAIGVTPRSGTSC